VGGEGGGVELSVLKNEFDEMSTGGCEASSYERSEEPLEGGEWQ